MFFVCFCFLFDRCCFGWGGGGVAADLIVQLADNGACGYASRQKCGKCNWN